MTGQRTRVNEGVARKRARQSADPNGPQHGAMRVWICLTIAGSFKLPPTWCVAAVAARFPARSHRVRRHLRRRTELELQPMVDLAGRPRVPVPRTGGPSRGQHAVERPKRLVSGVPSIGAVCGCRPERAHVACCRCVWASTYVAILCYWASEVLCDGRGLETGAVR